MFLQEGKGWSKGDGSSSVCSSWECLWHVPGSRITLPCPYCKETRECRFPWQHQGGWKHHLVPVTTGISFVASPGARAEGGTSVGMLLGVTRDGASCSSGKHRAHNTPVSTTMPIRAPRHKDCCRTWPWSCSPHLEQHKHSGLLQHLPIRGTPNLTQPGDHHGWAQSKADPTRSSPWSQQWPQELHPTGLSSSLLNRHKEKGGSTHTSLIVICDTPVTF